MSQCLRCSKLCEPTAVFCEDCRSLLRYQLQQRPHLYASQQQTSSTSADPPTLSEHAGVQGNPLARITSPLPINRVHELTQPQALTVQPDLVEQAVTRLNEAAHLIEQEEELYGNERKPRLYSRVSRLSPIVDISADIRRESTPLPKISGSGSKENNGNASALVDSNSLVPDYWPWFDDDDPDEKENDIWANRTDPLISRHIPTSAESAQIEEEDIRRAQAERISTRKFPVLFFKRHSSRMNIAFIALAVFAVIALIVDGLLLNVAFHHSYSKVATSHGYPALILSQHAASPGSTVQVKLTNFSTEAHVVLTHDIQEPITVNGNSSITTDATGSASFPLVIDNTWGPGFHLIVAEDVKTRSTASANLQIINAGISQPAHLLIDTRPLAMGADYVGTNTIRSFKLANDGSGSISWSANSQAPWLLISPSQGIFSQQEILSVAVQRLGLKPGDYHSTITITSNVSPAQHIEVDMSVQALPVNAGPVLAVTPALLSFTAADGQPNPSPEMLTISNPGSQSLNWSLNPVSLNPVPIPACNWLSVSPLSGSVDPGASRTLLVNVQSQCLLPGTYSGTFTFTAAGALDSTQSVTVSVVVQPHCGLVTSTGFLAFTVVAGQTTLANQSFSLNGTSSCAGTPLSWKAASTASWLLITPGNGQVQGTSSSVVTASVNAARLSPQQKPYYAYLTFNFGQNSLTLLAQLTVQAAPPSSPIMSASPLSLSFINIEGQPDPTGQVVSISNTGRSPLSWHGTASPFAPIWLNATPLGGNVPPGQSEQVTVKVNTSQLTPGNYVGQVTLNGMDAKGNAAPGSPLMIVVTLTIQPPCTLSPPSSSALSFSAVQGASASLASQAVLVTGTGSCVWPLTWKTSVSPAASWLTLTAAGTIADNGQSGSIGVTANTTGLKAGTYSTAVTISASDSNNVTVQGGTQTFTVTLTVLPPCALSPPTPSTLAITLAQGQATSSALTVGLSEHGTCARPVTWQASATSSWLTLNSSSGTDSGSGSSLGVNASAAGLPPGSYNATITITATDSSGTAVSNAQVVTVTLSVTGFSINGTVLACPIANCTSPLALAGATVTITSGSTTVATAMADASGAYSFSNIPSGSYTITATGLDGSNTHYTGAIPLNLSGNTSNVIINVLPG